MPVGDWKPKYLTILEFPSKQRLLEWYDSDAYRPWRELRERSESLDRRDRGMSASRRHGRTFIVTGAAMGVSRA